MSANAAANIEFQFCLLSKHVDIQTMLCKSLAVCFFIVQLLLAVQSSFKTKMKNEGATNNEEMFTGKPSVPSAFIVQQRGKSVVTMQHVPNSLYRPVPATLFKVSLLHEEMRYHHNFSWRLKIMTKYVPPHILTAYVLTENCNRAHSKNGCNQPICIEL